MLDRKKHPSNLFGRNVCNFGRSQSPINFSKSPKTLLSPAINIKYDNLQGNLEWHKNHFRIKVNKTKNSQHYVEFKIDTHNKNNIYYLNSVKFKIPAEHQINHYKPKLEIQFVHSKGPTDESNHNYKRLTLSLLVDDDPKNPNGDESLSKLNIVGVNEIKKIIQEVQSSGHFLYYGSLTEIPCTENNIWIVLTKKFTVSREFLVGIYKITHDRNNGKDNARLPNAINEREIWLYGKGPQQPGTLFSN